jgi:hypothetical protein
MSSTDLSAFYDLSGYSSPGSVRTSLSHDWPSRSLSSASSSSMETGGQEYSACFPCDEFRVGEDNLGCYFQVKSEGHLHGKSSCDGMSSLRSSHEFIELCTADQCFFGCGGKHSLTGNSKLFDEYGISPVHDVLGTMDCIEQEHSFGKPFDLVSLPVRRNTYLCTFVDTY